MLPCLPSSSSFFFFSLNSMHLLLPFKWVGVEDGGGIAAINGVYSGGTFGRDGGVRIEGKVSIGSIVIVLYRRNLPQRVGARVFDFAGDLPSEWAFILWNHMLKLKRTRDLKLRIQLATTATGFGDVADACMNELDKLPDNAASPVHVPLPVRS